MLPIGVDSLVPQLRFRLGGKPPSVHFSVGVGWHTVRTAYSRSLCTCNFAKNVHFCSRLAVYHPFLTVWSTCSLFTSQSFACLRRWNVETALGRRKAAKKNGGHTGPWLRQRSGWGQDSGGGCLGCRREGRRQLAQLPPECMDSAGRCSGGGSGSGRLGLPGTARAEAARSAG